MPEFTLRVSRDQKMAVLDGIPYRFSPGSSCSVYCGWYPVCVRDGVLPYQSACQASNRRDGLFGHWLALDGGKP